MVSRTLTTLLSIGVFVPIAITLHVYLTTRGSYRTVQTNGNSVYRNAWARNSKNWPTYLYFAVALTSLAFNLGMLISYLHSISLANIASTVSTTWEWIIITFNFVYWIVAVIIYRTEKDKHNVHDDLWGWSCSSGADNIQDAFNDLVNFQRMCRVQGTSWVVGLVQVGSLIVSATVMWFVLTRRSVKKQAKSTSMQMT